MRGRIFELKGSLKFASKCLMFMFPAPQAMVRYVARRGGLAGATPAEEARKARRAESARGFSHTYVFPLARSSIAFVVCLRCRGESFEDYKASAQGLYCFCYKAVVQILESNSPRPGKKGALGHGVRSSAGRARRHRRVSVPGEPAGVPGGAPRPRLALAHALRGHPRGKRNEPG